LITFRVALNYRLSLIHIIDRAVKLIRTPDAYGRARFIERYVIASLCQYTGRPAWLNSEELPEEVRTLRKTAVVAREVASVMRFLDWDICIANFLELNSKPGHKSRVVRKPRRTAPRSEPTLVERRASGRSHSTARHRAVRPTRHTRVK
jgi:hypothetical protein